MFRDFICKTTWSYSKETFNREVKLYKFLESESFFSCNKAQCFTDTATNTSCNIDEVIGLSLENHALDEILLINVKNSIKILARSVLHFPPYPN